MSSKLRCGLHSFNDAGAVYWTLELYVSYYARGRGGISGRENFVGPTAVWALVSRSTTPRFLRLCFLDLSPLTFHSLTLLLFFSELRIDLSWIHACIDVRAMEEIVLTGPHRGTFRTWWTMVG